MQLVGFTLRPVLSVEVEEERGARGHRGGNLADKVEAGSCCCCSIVILITLAFALALVDADM